MRLTPSLLVTVACSLWGLAAKQPLTWVPVSGALASVIDLGTRGWYMSDRVGEMRATSEILKTLLTLVGAYALLAMVGSIGIGIWWLVRAG